MNRKIIFLILIFSAIPAFVFSQNRQVLLEDLINNPGEHDQKIVFFQAEAIGEPLYTKSGNWINLASGAYYLSVFVEERAFIEKIKYWGSYREKGDLVRVRGRFYENCPSHHQLGAHLLGLEIAERGREVIHPVSPQKINFAFAGLIICLTTSLIYLIKMRRWKKK